MGLMKCVHYKREYIDTVCLVWTLGILARQLRLGRNTGRTYFFIIYVKYCIYVDLWHMDAR